MNDELVFLAGVSLSVVSAVGVAFYLRRHLRTLLRDLCGTQERADFWAAFSNVALVLVPLICALVHVQQDPPLPIYLALASQVKWALIGLVAAVMLLGFVLSWFILGTAFTPAAPAKGGEHGDARERS